ncbi:DNA sulfur modification protein DndD, partial [Anoxybacillus sp. LAT_11]|nr:DNA sulfur modification protein DndD [Anoxybacillus sp. LAT_11]
MIARERETLNEQVFLMEQEKKQITEKIKETAAELLPFLITQKLLQQTVTQIDAEERVERYNTLKEELNNETLPLLFKELSCHF